MRIHFPEELPVSAHRDELEAALRGHQVVVVAGETGSGKTTQLPKIALALGRGRGAGDGGLIGHTQPRRIAARSVAERLSDELEVELGQEVGFQVRFTDTTSAATRVKVMTDGILLAELQRDRDLRRYDTLIIDEAHERSLNIDFILGYLRRLLPRRPDLKVVITSATIDPQRFARHFGAEVPVVEVSGRTFPVELRYRPLARETDDEGEVVVRDQTEAVVDAVRELCAEGGGDVLVFLPGEREIRDTAEALSALAEGPSNSRGGFDVLPLFSRLSASEQHRVFAPHSRRRVVLSTNVAETSLTVPGIRYVVDTGVARISRYSVRTKVQRLPVEPVSQASADQRAGRCGRVAPGICIRLYDEEDYDSRPRFTDPEILRTNLASVILQMAALGLGEVARFEFLDPPDQRNVQAGVQLLEELGALRTEGSSAVRPEGSRALRAGGSRRRGHALTGTGRRLARLPIDPRLGRMILEADRLGALPQVLVVVAALSVQDPRERPAEEQARADQLHARFRDPTSDFLTWLNLWAYLRAAQRERGSSAFRRMCREEHLHYVRVREWQELVGQLRQVCREMGLKPGKDRAEGADGEDEVRRTWKEADAIHQALLSGLLSHVGLRDREKRDYLGARGTRWAVFPGSGRHRKQPDLAMAAELVETSRLYGRQVAAIDAAWAERLGAHLVKRQYAEPHWSRKRAAVMARERVTLYGVPLVADRLVDFGRHDPVVARELFIRHALVQGEWNSRHAFLATNRRLLEEAEELEHRARRRGIVVDEETLFDFYDARVGEGVVNGIHFDSWWKRTRRDEPTLLDFDPSMLVRDPDAVAADDFPSSWRVGAGTDLGLAYRFEPGAADDGVTVDVPVATLNRIDDTPFSWQVPGLRAELVTALLRSLPKRLRVSFVPAPDFARAFLADVPAGDEPLLEALARYLLGRTGVVVPPDAWDLSQVPEHLRPRFRVLDGERELASGRDLAVLARELRGSTERAVAAADPRLNRTGATAWVFGDITATTTQVRAGHEVLGYPTLVDEETSVGLRVVTSEEEQEARHRRGVRRLARLVLPDPTREVLAGLDNTQRLALASTPYPDATALVADCADAAVAVAVDAREPVRSEPDFAALLRDVDAEGRLAADTRAMLLRALEALAGWREAERLVSGRVPLPLLPAMSDLRAQVARLYADGFVAEAGTWLARYPVYLTALRQRVETLGRGGAAVTRDRQLLDQFLPVQEAWEHRLASLPPGRPPSRPLREVRWLLEELRVSLWAQSLGTAVPVSDARIRKALASTTSR